MSKAREFHVNEVQKVTVSAVVGIECECDRKEVDSMVIRKSSYHGGLAGWERKPKVKRCGALDKDLEQLESARMIDDGNRTEDIHPKLWSPVNGRTPKAADMAELDVLAGSGLDMTENLDQEF